MFDAHHGVLAELQLELVRRLTRLCPDLRLVTFEDPRFDGEGRMPGPVEASLDALAAVVGPWARGGGPTEAVRARPPSLGAVAEDDRDERELRAGFLADDAEGRRRRRQALDRPARGIGRPSELYAELLPPEDEQDALLTAFLASDEGQGWSEFAWAVPGRAIEDALGRFLEPGGRLHRLACAKLLLMHPDPPFVVPDGFRRAPRGWFAVGGTRERPELVAAVDGALRVGPITPLIARLLDGERVVGAEPAVAELRRMGVLA